MTDILHALGWSFLAFFWTMFLTTACFVVVIEPETKEKHEQVDYAAAVLSIACGVMVFFLLM